MGVAGDVRFFCRRFLQLGGGLRCTLNVATGANIFFLNAHVLLLSEKHLIEEPLSMTEERLFSLYLPSALRTLAM